MTFICGDFAPADGQWHELGYVDAVEHKCDACGYSSHYVMRDGGRTRRGKRRDLYWCGGCHPPSEAP